VKNEKEGEGRRRFRRDAAPFQVSNRRPRGDIPGRGRAQALQDSTGAVVFYFALPRRPAGFSPGIVLPCSDRSTFSAARGACVLLSPDCAFHEQTKFVRVVFDFFNFAPLSLLSRLICFVLQYAP